MMVFVLSLVTGGTGHAQSLKLLFAGDLMGHGPQIKVAQQIDGGYDYAPCFRYVEDYIQSADLAILNLEVPLAGNPYSGYPQFSAPDALAACAKEAGFDIMTTAKALGCGLPVGAFLTTEKAAALVPGDHGSTYGGNPLVCSASSKIFDLYEELHILENVRATGAYLFEKLEELKDSCDLIVAHRGIGFMQGLEFSVPVADIIKKAQAAGLILINAGTNILRFVPPLICAKDDVDEMVRILKGVLDNT